MSKSNKKQLGKYYTITNPFNLKVFKDWFDSIPDIANLTIVEPFAGSNNIVKLMNVPNNWNCYDISPTANLVPQFSIIQRDTIANFPQGYSVGITNPPYLAKNSATRSKITYHGDPYDDLYKKCLEVMLDNLDYVAVIIPESFITAGIFQERLDCFISLTCKMFNDTDCPVCLALFSPRNYSDFSVYQMDNFIGNYNKNLIWYKIINRKLYNWKFNDPLGEIGINAIDNTLKDSIQFIPGVNYNSGIINNSCRSYTRVSLNGYTVKDLPLFLSLCNDCLDWYRSNTNDIFMTSFKGLRKDGKYRRRLDWDTAKGIMEMVLDRFKDRLL